MRTQKTINLSLVIAVIGINIATTAQEISKQGRVVGGQKVTDDGQWPWQVYVQISTVNVTVGCGGTVIHKNWVLSAAHCFGEGIDRILLRFGFNDLNNFDNRIYRIATHHNHEDYDPVTKFADISLLQFFPDMEFNDMIQPISLPTATTALTDNQTCIISGFGMTAENGATSSVLQYAEVGIISLAICNEWYNEFGVNVTDDHICAGYEEGGVDSCQGDSGGPLFCQSPCNSSQYVIEGIISHGIGCARPRQPGSYTSVESFLSWIERIMNTTTGLTFDACVDAQSSAATTVAQASDAKEVTTTAKTSDAEETTTAKVTATSMVSSIIKSTITMTMYIPTREPTTTLPLKFDICSRRSLDIIGKTFITSPNYPEIFVDDLNCEMTIWNREQRGRVIVEIQDFHSVPDQDYLEISGIENGSIILSGDHSSGRYDSTENSIMLRFTTGATTSDTRFSLTIKPANNCCISIFISHFHCIVFVAYVHMVIV